MTPTEMETLLQKLDARVANIEQILPTLATREGLAAVRTELAEEIRSSANGLRVLIEASRDDTRVLAEHVLDLMTRLPRGQ